jgi:hypothetical protein
MAIEPADQTTAAPGTVQVGCLGTMTIAQFKALCPPDSVYIFGETVSVHRGGGMVSFRNGVPYHLEPSMVAFLTASGVPMALA